MDHVSGDERAVKIGRKLLVLWDWFPRILIIISQSVAMVAGLGPSKNLAAYFPFLGEFGRGIETEIALVAVSVVLLVLGTVLEIRRSRSLSEAEEALETSLKVHHALKVQLKQELKELCEELELSHEGVSRSKDNQALRLTLYINHPSDAIFIPVMRFSTDPMMEKTGRKYYPDSEGMIGAGWKKGWSFIRDLPEEREAWINKQIEAFGYERETASEIKMQSRSFGWIRLSEEETHVGILVFESEAPRGIGATIGEKVLESQSYSYLCKVLPAIKLASEYEIKT